MVTRLAPGEAKCCCCLFSVLKQGEQALSSPPLDSWPSGTILTHTGHSNEALARAWPLTLPLRVRKFLPYRLCFPLSLQPVQAGGPSCYVTTEGPGSRLAQLGPRVVTKTNQLK